MEVLLRLDRDRLLRAREVLGYGLEKTAEEAGVSKNSVLRAEHGAEIRPVTARKIAAALGVEVADLLGAGHRKTLEVPDTPLARSSLEDFEARLWGLGSEAEARALFEAVRRERGALEDWMTGYVAAPNDERFAYRQDFEAVEQDLVDEVLGGRLCQRGVERQYQRAVYAGIGQQCQSLVERCQARRGSLRK